ncbi:MAG: acetate kinase [Eubacteriales bacterium]
MKVLVINAGSSSLKYQLISMTNEEVLAKGIVERIAIDGSVLKHQVPGKEKAVMDMPLKNHTEAIKLVLDTLVDKEHGVIESMNDIAAVGHRVVHGGEKFSESVLIDDEVMKAIKDNIDLAPLHNPANIMGIEACKEIMPNKKQVAVFDTAFHQSMPERAYLYGIPYKYYRDNKVRRYGFHGTSHKFISQEVAKVMDKKVEELRTIICHLGNGGSVSAVKHGKSVDTSMGLTPLEGVLMGTRCGDLDPSIVEYIMQIENMSIGEVMDILNKKSGILGVSEISSDMRDIEAEVANDNKAAIRVYNLFCYRVKKYIGAYAAAMGGVDVIVFTAGIGENNPDMRADILEDMEFLGLEIDRKTNDSKADLVQISTKNSKVAAYSIATNEEVMIARDTLELVGE